MIDEPNKLLDIKHLSAWLGVGESTIYHWTAQRAIPFTKVGRLMRFEKSEIDRWIAARKVHAVESNVL